MNAPQELRCRHFRRQGLDGVYSLEQQAARGVGRERGARRARQPRSGDGVLARVASPSFFFRCARDGCHEEREGMGARCGRDLSTSVAAILTKMHLCEPERVSALPMSANGCCARHGARPLCARGAVCSLHAPGVAHKMRNVGAQVRRVARLRRRRPWHVPTAGHGDEWPFRSDDYDRSHPRDDRHV